VKKTVKPSFLVKKIDPVLGSLTVGLFRFFDFYGIVGAIYWEYPTSPPRQLDVYTILFVEGFISPESILETED